MAQHNCYQLYKYLKSGHALGFASKTSHQNFSCLLSVNNRERESLKII